jgi:tetratricopeptide repeat protein
MISCRRARSLLDENLRGSVAETALLQLDQHLVDCASCQAERARVSTLAALRDWDPPGLGATARARISAQLVASRQSNESAATPRAGRSRVWLFAGVGVAAAAAALIALTARRHLVVAPASAPSLVRFLDAELRYGAGTRVKLEPAARTIALDGGELEITSRAAAPIRVVTPRFVVVVSYGRARFAGEQIRVYSGEIVVFSLDARKLATVAAGETWRLPATTPPPPVTIAPAPIAPPPAAPTVAPPKLPAPSANRVAAALDRARSALAAGDTTAARRWAHQAFSAASAARDRAEAELFLAESYLVEHEPDRAITVYRQVAESFPRLPEGEAAAFAAAQVLYERGRVAEARAALRSYVAQYPDGRFAREATDRLSALAE